jgi:hypothetical protein
MVPEISARDLTPTDLEENAETLKCWNSEFGDVLRLCLSRDNAASVQQVRLGTALLLASAYHAPAPVPVIKRRETGDVGLATEEDAEEGPREVISSLTHPAVTGKADVGDAKIIYEI